MRLEHFWIFFIYLFFWWPFLRILKHVTEVDPSSSQKSHCCHKLLSHSCHNHWIACGTSQNHILCGRKHNETFVLHCTTWQLALLPLLKYLQGGTWAQVRHWESELMLLVLAMLWLLRDPPGSGCRLFTKFNGLNWGKMGNPVSWDWLGLVIFIVLNPRDWSSGSIISPTTTLPP